jgi:hypothetical protein
VCVGSSSQIYRQFARKIRFGQRYAAVRQRRGKNAVLSLIHTQE